MELKRVIEYLRQQRLMLDETIACLEKLGQNSVVVNLETPVKRRGRKFMAPEDREKVSERMKRYWAARRNQKTYRAGATGGLSILPKQMDGLG